MARPRTRSAYAFSILALLSLSVGLAACAALGGATQTTSAATATSPTTASIATATTSPTQTLAPLAPTPTNKPAGWAVLATPQFSLAYPSNLSVNTVPPSADYPYTVYYVTGATKGTGPSVRLSVQPQAPASDLSAYCAGGSAYQTFANLPMHYDVEGEGQSMRTWDFANSAGTAYILQASDANADATTQEADTAILATFRSDDATPRQC